ncbi:type VI secretion system protein TssL, long form [Sapientia aquatica]|nr:type VI secretion system protein TssL, long form [Sapientia aquatica]
MYYAAGNLRPPSPETGDEDFEQGSATQDTAIISDVDGQHFIHSHRATIDTIVAAGSETSEERTDRFTAISAARNPLLEAAKPLLLAIATMPKQLNDPIQIEGFRGLLKREIRSFQDICAKANIRREHLITASFCLCTALDEAASSTYWGGSQNLGDVGIWASGLLSESFHQDSHGGKKFFLLVARLSSNPTEHGDLLEVMYHILSLGFEGQYHNDPNGQRQLEATRYHLFTQLSNIHGAFNRELSPNWVGVPHQKSIFMRSLPVWALALVCGLGLLIMFGWYQYQLSSLARQVTNNIMAIEKMAPPPQAIKQVDLATLLKDEIKQGLVTVVEKGDRTEVIFKGDDMFVLGQSSVNKKMIPLLNKVAAEIAKVAGNIQVIGHSDNQPINTPQFPNNQALSLERAVLVADVLQSAGVAAGRMEISGRGDSSPIESNSTPTGRAKNRRVEIVLVGSSAPKSTLPYPTSTEAPTTKPSTKN